MIPYTIDRRADTGVTNVTLGIWLFLASEVMLFGALFSAYTLLRVSAPQWPHGRDVLDLLLGSINTVVLLASSVVVWLARRRVAPRWLGLATALALAFVAIKLFEYRGEMARGFHPATSTFLAMYYVLTGFHALHVIGGIIANLWVIIGANRAGAAVTTGRLQGVGLYWAFVDLMWIVMFTLLYLS